MCVNLALFFLAIILLPVLAIVVPLLGIIYHTAIRLPYKYTFFLTFWKKFLVYLFFILILTPIAVVLGMAAVAICYVFAIWPLYYYTIRFFIKLCIAGYRTKL
jgi:hypothetical protein